jgi:hypothetical protein
MTKSLPFLVVTFLVTTHVKIHELSIGARTIRQESDKIHMSFQLVRTRFNRKNDKIHLTVALLF